MKNVKYILLLVLFFYACSKKNIVVPKAPVVVVPKIDTQIVKKVDTSSFEVVEDYIKKLFEENDYPISEHRTKGIVHIGEYNENTTVEIRYFNEPEDGSFNDYDFVIEGWCPLVNNYTV